MATPIENISRTSERPVDRTLLTKELGSPPFGRNEEVRPNAAGPRLNLLDRELGLSFGPSHLVGDQGLKALVNKNRATVAWMVLSKAGVVVDQFGRFPLSNTLRDGRFLAGLVAQAGQAGDPTGSGLANVTRVGSRLAGLAQRYGLSKEFVQGYQQVQQELNSATAANVAQTLISQGGRVVARQPGSPTRQVRQRNIGPSDTTASNASTNPKVKGVNGVSQPKKTVGTTTTSKPQRLLEQGDTPLRRVNPKAPDDVSIATRQLLSIPNLPQAKRNEFADFLVRSNPESYANRSAALDALSKATQIYALRDPNGVIIGTATLRRSGNSEWYLGQVASAAPGAGGDVMKGLLSEFGQLAKNTGQPVRIWAYTNKAENVYNARDPSKPGFYSQLGAQISDSNQAGAGDMSTRRRIDIEWRFGADGQPVR